MMDRNENIAFCAIGFMAGAILLALLPVVFDSDSAAEQFVETYQTLITGFLAVLVGWLTVHYMKRQERLVLEQMERQRDRDERLGRATLIISLDAVSEYAEICVRVANEYNGRIHANVACIPPGPEVPSLDSPILDSLARAASVLNPTVGVKIARLLIVYQVQHARLMSLASRYNQPSTGLIRHPARVQDAEQATRDAVRLHLMADELYEEARQEDDDLNISDRAISRRTFRILGARHIRPDQQE